MIQNQIITVNDQRWKIIEATTMEAALSEIAMARCTGSVGSSTSVDNTACGGTKYMLADVVKVNSDDSEVQPYSQVY